MDNEVQAWLYDILNAITEIETYLPEERISLEQFSSDLKTKRAVERNLEIIGEAVNRINKKSPEILLSDARKIIDTRNRIIHSYDSVSDDILWTIVYRHLPKLKSEVELFLKK